MNMAMVLREASVSPREAFIFRDSAETMCLERKPTLVLRSEQSSQFTILAGQRGSTGQAGASGSALPAVNFAYGDASPMLIHTFDSPALLAELQLVIQQPFDGAGAQLVLRTQDSQILMAADQNAPGLVATFETTPAAQMPAGSAVYLEITPGSGATTGAGQILLNLH